MPIWLIVTLLGVVEGITEFIPISSTGHLLVTEKLLQMIGALSADHWLVAASSRKDLFNVVIQCGAVVAVLPLFRDRVVQFTRVARDPGARDYFLKLFTAFLITGTGGLALEKMHFRLPEELLPVALALLVGGILFVILEGWLKDRPAAREVTWAVAVGVGVAQLVAALFPGTSRSGATIIVALALGLNRVAATEFTFLLGIPTMLSAGGLKILKQLQVASGAPADYWTMVILGTVISAMVSFVAVKWLLKYVQTHTFLAFGWYRIGLAAVILLLAALAGS